MNKYHGTEKDIHTRIYQFVINCFSEIIRGIPKNVENIPIISQISASLTSMGANDREADASASKRDFIAKYVIVRKETKETDYWLSVIRDLKLIPNIIVQPHIVECEEILKIVSSIINSAQK